MGKNLVNEGLPAGVKRKAGLAPYIAIQPAKAYT